MIEMPRLDIVQYTSSELSTITGPLQGVETSGIRMCCITDTKDDILLMEEILRTLDSLYITWNICSIIYFDRNHNLPWET